LLQICCVQQQTLVQMGHRQLAAEASGCPLKLVGRPRWRFMQFSQNI
jgi:hypothetical protein